MITQDFNLLFAAWMDNPLAFIARRLWRNLIELKKITPSNDSSLYQIKLILRIKIKIRSPVISRIFPDCPLQKSDNWK